MRAVDIIAKKRDGHALLTDEIRWFIDAFTRGTLPDYQASALLMAILLKGMDVNEVTALTMIMAESGHMLDLSSLSNYVVDKHSSGGVGDKTSLVVLPLVAACGVPVAKMSGRSLGYSGGTLDKIESIAGFNVNLDEARFMRQAQQIGIALAGQTKDLAPADGKLYALRDVTATVPSIPLIASSIMSKKIAAGANGIVLDVKVGSGAFMASVEEAQSLAQTMVAIGKQIGRDMVALISDMSQPLGYAVGNALEVKEAIETLQGSGPADLEAHCLEVAAHMLKLAKHGERWQDLEAARQELETCLHDGSGLEKFKAMVVAQDGDVTMVDDPSRLPQANIIEAVKVEASGYVSRLDALEVAVAAFNLGAGRETKETAIDLAVGVRTHYKVGDSISNGDTIATLYANDEAKLQRSISHIHQAIEISPEPVEPLPLFHDIITS
jgi:pyrimidine-nucleoside phosphorylase